VLLAAGFELDVLRERDDERFAAGRDDDRERVFDPLLLRFALEDVDLELLAIFSGPPLRSRTCVPALGLPDLQGN
jgi:hypothetical protein